MGVPVSDFHEQLWYPGAKSHNQFATNYSSTEPTLTGVVAKHFNHTPECLWEAELGYLRFSAGDENP